MLEPTPAEVVAAVSAAVGIDVDDILGEGRATSVARARRLAMAVARWTTGWSYPEIGRFFGRDHTTVHHAVHRVENDERDSRLARRLVELVALPDNAQDSGLAIHKVMGRS